MQNLWKKAFPQIEHHSVDGESKERDLRIFQWSSDELPYVAVNVPEQLNKELELKPKENCLLKLPISAIPDVRHEHMIQFAKFFD